MTKKRRKTFDANAAAMEQELATVVEQESDDARATSDPLAVLNKALDSLEGWSDRSALLAASARKALVTLQDDVRASEREACAKVANDRAVAAYNRTDYLCAQDIAAGIRARGK